MVYRLPSRQTISTRTSGRGNGSLPSETHHHQRGNHTDRGTARGGLAHIPRTPLKPVVKWVTWLECLRLVVRDMTIMALSTDPLLGGSLFIREREVANFCALGEGAQRRHAKPWRNVSHPSEHTQRSEDTQSSYGLECLQGAC